MRPRVFPAEDPVRQGRASVRQPRFNEAAGIPRGRLQVRHLHRVVHPRQASMRPRVFPAEDASAFSGTADNNSFNEAAGIPRGRLCLAGSFHGTPYSVLQ